MPAEPPSTPPRRPSRPTRRETVTLATASATYNIAVGSALLRTLAAQLAELSPSRSLRPFLVTSPAIWKLWSAAVLASFPSTERPPVLFVPPGEQHKRLATVERLADELHALGADRDALLVAFGGGVLGDITGFLAAVYMRGVSFVQIPTTLLAQVDSSVGGKTGVNLQSGKNLVGAFHQPLAVVADLDLLSTLPPRELRAGAQEIVKAAIIRDRVLFSLLERTADAIAAGDLPALRRPILRAIEIKAAIVGEDERESGARMLLNFGHTLGHAIEAATGYKRLLHGEAVGWGSIAALHLARDRGNVSPAQFTRMASLIYALGPLPRFRASAAELVSLSAGDKKHRGGRRAFVLPCGIGAAEVVFDVSDAELLRAAEAMLEDMRAGADIPAADVGGADTAGADIPGAEA